MVFSDAVRMNRPMPVSVPRADADDNGVDVALHLARRSGPVLVSCARGFTGLANWLMWIAPGVRRARASARS